MKDIFLYEKSDIHFVKKFSKETNLDCFNYKFSKFNNGEIFIKIPYDVRDKKIFILVKTSKNVSNFQNIIFLISELFNKKAKSINIICFFIPYLRQFLKEKSKNIFDILTKSIFYSGANRIITLDPHCNSFLKKYKNKFSIISATGIFIKKIKSLNLNDFCFISPDKGAKEINFYLATYFNKEVLISQKNRNSQTGNVENINFKEDIKVENVIIVDDIIDSGETINCLINLILKKKNEVNIFIFCSHLILSKNPLFLKYDQVKLLFSTDSLKNLKQKNTKIVIESLNNILIDFIKNNEC